MATCLKEIYLNGFKLAMDNILLVSPSQETHYL